MIYPLRTKIVITQPWGVANAVLTGGIHRGVDYRAAHGTAVYSITYGTVLSTGFSRGAGFFVLVRSGDLVHHYYHLSRIDANSGDLVKEGGLLGLSGSSGLSTGPHLHLETWLNGINVDPDSVINDKYTPPVVSPSLPMGSRTVVIKENDTLWGIEQARGIAFGTLQLLNPNVDPLLLQIGSTLVVPDTIHPEVVAVRRTYTIKQGDTFWDLHNAWQMAQGTLQVLNPSVDVHNLQIGQSIYIS